MLKVRGAQGQTASPPDRKEVRSSQLGDDLGGFRFVDPLAEANGCRSVVESDDPSHRSPPLEITIGRGTHTQAGDLRKVVLLDPSHAPDVTLAVKFRHRAIA